MIIIIKIIIMSVQCAWIVAGSPEKEKYHVENCYYFHFIFAHTHRTAVFCVLTRKNTFFIILQFSHRIIVIIKYIVIVTIIMIIMKKGIIIKINRLIAGVYNIVHVHKYYILCK